MTAGQLEQIRAVVFDFDGTLAETEIDFAEMRRRTVEHIKSWGLWEEGMDRDRYVLELIDHAAAKLASGNGAVDEYRREAAQILEDVEMLTCPGARPYPGIQEMLNALRTRGLRVGIVTRNCRRGVRAVTENHHLHHDVLLTRDDVARVKPDPEHLLLALARLEVEPSGALMVGDHITDIQVGKAARTFTCGVLTARTEREAFVTAGADLILDSAADLVHIICIADN